VQALLAVPVRVNVTTEGKNSRYMHSDAVGSSARRMTAICSCSIDARYYLGDPALYITGCINRDSAPSVQVAAAIKCHDFTASLLSAALNQAGVLISSISSGNCASANWSWNIKHTSLPLSNLMNHTLQERCIGCSHAHAPACLHTFDSPCSDNLYAEAWLQSLAVQQSPPVETAFSSQYPTTPTRDAALETARALLMQMGVDGDLFHQKDGR
jgi:D-alanyl-D-alanine carboxypeptidase